jgi:hypothetical protein
VSRSATTNEPACTAGGVAPAATTFASEVSWTPPTGLREPRAAAFAVSGPATSITVVAHAVRSTRIGGTLDNLQANSHAAVGIPTAA